MMSAFWVEIGTWKNYYIAFKYLDSNTENISIKIDKFDLTKHNWLCKFADHSSRI